jgi:CSLREA domain-containing protein
MNAKIFRKALSFTLEVLIALIVTLSLTSQHTVAAPSGLTLYVNNTADAPDWNPGDGKCETASNNGICTLRAAIMEANTYTGWDTINLQAGATYSLSRPGVDDSAYNGDLDITDKLTINGAGATVDGGGLDRVFDVPATFVFVTINNLIVFNGSVSGNGGGIHNLGILTLSHVIITQNHSSGDGGGIASEGPYAITVLNNGGISSNIGGLGGGGLYNNSSQVTIDNSMITANKENSYAGGGIENYLGTVTLRNSTINSNTSAGNGGGIMTTGTSSAGSVVTLINSTVVYNIAAHNGGGIYNDGGTIDNPSTVYLYNATISGNVAVTYSGGGLSVSPNFVSYADLWNTLVADNRQGSNAGPLQDCAGTIYSGDYNLIRTTSGCTVTGLTAHNKTNIGALEGGLWYYGGPTQTLSLLAGSPAIEGGNPSGCIDNHGALLTTDQRGYLRPTGGRCDIGAFEMGAFLAAYKLLLPVVRR